MSEEGGKAANQLPVWGNEKTMNLNTMILANIQGSPYFKIDLYKLKTYHQVIDEIYYHVKHLEPWEPGSRKTSGQTGMCGGVRGVGAGGIVSTAFCCLYKLYTLRLTRKQLYGLLDHPDSPYIRALGFMYIRFTQPPQDFISWFEPYFDDEEEFDVRAGGGETMTIGELVRYMLQSLDWYSTLFPRIPVPVQKQINAVVANKFPKPKPKPKPVAVRQENHESDYSNSREADRFENKPPKSRDQRHRSRSGERRRSRERERRSDSRERRREKKHKKEYRDRSRSRNRSRDRKDKYRDVRKDRSRDRKRY